MVVFDTSAILLALDPCACSQVEDGPAKVKYLLECLEADKEKVLIPTPVFSELLVGAGNAFDHWVELISSSAAFRVAPFDTKAAMEAAVLHKEAMERGPAQKDATKAKLKFDRMIVAVAKAEGAHSVYAGDNGLLKDAVRGGLTAIPLEELPLPPQGELNLE